MANKNKQNKISPVTLLRRRGLLEQASIALKKIETSEQSSGEYLIEKLFVDLENRVEAISILGGCQALENDHKLSPLQKGKLLVAKGVGYNRNGEPDQAQNYLLEALETFESLKGQEALFAETLDHLGNVQAWLGDFPRALTSFSRSTSILLGMDDPEGVARNQGNLGRLYLEVCQYNYAVEFLGQALAVQQQWGQSRELIRLEENLARALNGMGDFERAYEIAKNAVNQAKDLDEGYLNFICLREQTIAAIGLSKSNAKALTAELVTMGAKGGEYEQASAQLVDGQYLLGENANEAVTVLMKAREWFRDRNLTVPAISTARLLTLAYLSLGEKAKAANILTMAINRVKIAGLKSLERGLRELQVEHDLFDGILFEKDKNISDDREAAKGGYLVREILGSGAYGSVVRAFDLEKDHEVALKTIKLSNLYDTSVRNDLIQSARRELAATAPITHPGVSEVYALGELENGDFYVVQELIKGKTLRQVIGEGVPSLELFLEVMNGVAYALDALHGANVLHRDLKPENVIIKDDGSPVLIDFGISHVPKEHIEVEVKSGSGAYMAPEVILGKKQEAPLDAYAWGVMAYEWLVGERPFEHPKDRLTIFNRFGETSRFTKALKRASPDFPKNIHSLIISSFAFNYKKRPQTAKQLVFNVETNKLSN